MKKKYLKGRNNKERCPLCNKLKSRFTEYNNEFICDDCYLSIAINKFRNENPTAYRNFKTRGNSKPFSFSKGKFSKSIYAVDGVTSIYHSGCTN